MKSAGKVSSNSFVPCSGCPRWAKGIEPESNQASSTSGTRRMTPSHLSHGSVTVTMNGRCRSVSALRPSSADELMHFCCSQLSHTQNGSGVPPLPEHEIDQSTLFSSQLPLRH